MIVEGSCARCWVLRDRAGAAEVVVAWTFWTSSAVETLGFVVEEYRPYFENYTVDASILKMRTKWERTSVRERIVRVTNYPDSPRGCSGLLM